MCLANLWSVIVQVKKRYLTRHKAMLLQPYKGLLSKWATKIQPGSDVYTVIMAKWEKLYCLRGFRRNQISYTEVDKNNGNSIIVLSASSYVTRGLSRADEHVQACMAFLLKST